MTRAGKEREQEATSDSVDSSNSSSLPPLGKRKGTFGDGTSSSKKKVGKRRHSNNTDTTTLATSSKSSKKGKAKTDNQQHKTTNTSTDAETTYGEQNHETGDHGSLKSPLAGIEPTHSDNKMAVIDNGGGIDQQKVKTGLPNSSGVDDDSSSDSNHEDDTDDPENLDDHHDGMLLDSGVGDIGDHFIGFADGFHGDNEDDEDDGDYDRYEQDEEYGMYDPFSSIRNGTSGQQFRAILENLKNNDDQTRQLKSLQNLAETLSISNEETLAGYFPCDAFAQELVKIMKGSTGPNENENEDGGMDGVATLNDQNGGGNPELMVLACRCISNLLDVFPSAAPRMVNFGVVDALCDKLRSIQYIDLAEQALEALKEIAGQAPLAVIQNGGLGVAFMYFDFFNIYSQRTALQMASQCMRFINIDFYQQLVEALPALTNTLASSDRTIVELTCLCWARLSENYRSTPIELEKVLSTDILNTMVGLLPVPGNANAIRSSAFNDILRVFRSVAKASPTLGYQLLHLDIMKSFYQVLTGATDISTSPTSLISLDNTWHHSLHTILNIIIDLLPPLPKDQEFDWDRFKKMEPIALRTRLRMAQQPHPASSSSASTTTNPSSSTASKTTSVPDPRTELLGGNPRLLQRIGVILFPLLLEIFSSTVNLAIRQSVTHTLVKLVFFMDVDSLKFALQDIPLSAFLADLLAHQEHSAFVIDALFQAELLLKKLPGIYSTLFQREGVYHGTKALANQKMVEDDALPNAKGNSSEETKGAPLWDNVATVVHINKKSGRSDIMQRPSTYSLDYLSSIASLTKPIKDVTHGSSHQHNMQPNINQTMEQRPINDGRSGIGYGLLRQFIIQQAQNHIKDYGAAPRTGQKHGMDSLQVLKQLANGFVGTPDDITARKVLEKLVSYINSTVVGISGFELLESGIMEALLDYLTVQQQQQQDDGGYAASLVQRRQELHTVFLETLELDPETGLLLSPALRILIQRLETLLTRCERFKVELPLGSTMSPSSASSGIMQNPVHWVTKQIRLRLHGQGHHISAEYQHLTVTTQAVSTFHTLEKYLLAYIIGTGTIQNKLKADNTQNDGDKMAPSRNTEAMDLDKTKLDVKDSPSQTSLQNHPGETALSSTSYATVSLAGSSALSIPSALSASASLSSSSSSSLPVPLPLSSSTSTSTSSSATTPSIITTGKPPKIRNGNWKVQFYINNTLISNDTSLYGAIHRSETKKSEENGSHAGNYNIWTAAHSVTFKCVSIDNGTGNTERKKANPTRKPEGTHPPPSPKQLAGDKNGTCMKILQLLKELAIISQSSSPQSSKLGKTVTTLVPMTDFVNRKLTTKMQRQLEEPLIVASACLPDWATYCMLDCPFLFPFDVRYLYLQSTSFGVPRLISNWQNIHRRNNSTRDGQLPTTETGGRPEISGGGGGELFPSRSTVVRLERKRVQVRRDQILDDAIKLMATSGNSKSVLEIGYMDEEGTGLGPTLEFYSLASKEFCKLSTHMWRQEERDDPSEGDDDQGKLYVVSQHGLFPAPLSKQMHQKSRGEIVRLFKTLGQFVAKSILDSRMIDIPFNVAFFKRLFHSSNDPLELVMDIDPVLGKSISHLQAYVDKKQIIENDTSLTPKKRDELIKNIEINGAKIEDLYLDFTLPGRADVDLKPNGSKIPVTIGSVEEYIQLLVDMIAGSGVKEQLSAFRDGFNGLLSIKSLKVLNCQELVSLFGSSTEDWSYSTLADTIKADHGFTMDSVTIKNLLEILSEMTIQEQRGFLQFTTGSPRLPIGGWKSMRPMFTVVKKNCDAPLGPDDYLPSVMTCANYLKVPDYTNKKIMHTQLLKSMREGKNSFLLS